MVETCVHFCQNTYETELETETDSRNRPFLVIVLSYSSRGLLLPTAPTQIAQDQLQAVI